ncbi:type II toxin-antitoxin system toxin TscT [Staphylococcus cohnii]|uniref:type II toxin-antitoxin system toxin TscT n=1 Tax=Staphylococcus cohnii TaxID=29382 RepID=UPI003CEA248B
MNWNQKDLICEFELLKDKMDDVVTAHVWHGDDMYRFKELKNSYDKEHYTLGYNESRIQHEHTTELMQVYLQRFDDLIKDFKALDIEKASSDESLATESDNA